VTKHISRRFQTLKSTDALRKAWPWLDEWLNDLGHAQFKPVLAQVTPLLLVILFALVPPIINALLRLLRPVSFSSQVLSFFQVYFYFLVIQVFLFYTVAGSIFQSIKSILDHPSEIFSFLATSVPSNQVFFLQVRRFNSQLVAAVAGVDVDVDVDVDN
jgi:hypothetical protein